MILCFILQHDLVNLPHVSPVICQELLTFLNSSIQGHDNSPSFTRFLSSRIEIQKLNLQHTIVDDRIKIPNHSKWRHGNIDNSAQMMSHGSHTYRKKWFHFLQDQKKGLKSSVDCVC
ncbi:hypothetical protein GQ457_08G012040 [Hibiscus cannabinus]